MPPLSNLEPAIYDLDEMCSLAVAHFEDTFSSENAQARKGARIGLSSHEERLILFRIYHLSRMAADLRSAFYAKLEEGRG